MPSSSPITVVAVGVCIVCGHRCLQVFKYARIRFNVAEYTGRYPSIQDDIQVYNTIAEYTRRYAIRLAVLKISDYPRHGRPRKLRNFMSIPFSITWSVGLVSGAQLCSIDVSMAATT